MLLAVAALATQSCAVAPLVWSKPDSNQGEASAALAECRALAVDEMWRMSWEETWPPVFYDPRFMPRIYRRSTPFWLGVPSSLELERELTEFCMHSKGFRLSATD
jgi:hypothetical protein